ncbi:MAG: YidC/Oxa1 family membrane protein insertase [Patescibacteria group bacterium]
MYQLYHTLLFQPLLNLLIWLYNLIGDIGVAIILVTVLIRLILLIPSQKALKAQKTMQELQPKLDEIRKKYKDDKKKQSEEMMKFYQEKKINPLGSCLPMLIQLPILFALYSVFRKGLQADSMQFLYSFVERPEHINTMFLGFLDMLKPNAILAVVAGMLQFFQSKMMMKKQKSTALGSMPGLGNIGGMMSKQMTYLMPAMTVFIALSLPSGLALYWATTTAVAILQQWVIMRNHK